jgi:methionyl-tRNA synthetase
MGNFYLTTTLPYVNAEPHIGFALEIVQADAIARYRRLTGHEVFFNFGTDEHGQKIYEKAREAGKDPQAYVDEYAAKFDALKEALNLSYNAFIRTTDPAHVSAAQEFWRRCAASGDIYKKAYKGKYCVGCELEKTESELENGRCPIHPNLEIQVVEEENYFFRFSKYTDALTKLYANHPDFVIPAFRLNEIKSLIERIGLNDFSISRLTSKMSWGVPVPDDPNHVMFVWFDALVNYITTIGWPTDMATFEKWWPVVQFAGKDNLRQQSAMWQAMLMSAGLPPSKQIFIHGFITANGEKMSKSLGNVIDPIAEVQKYGTDAVRYFLLRHIHPFEDSDYSRERFVEAYNGNLANGLGNLVARTMRLAEDNLDTPVTLQPFSYSQEYQNSINAFEFNRAMDYIWDRIQKLDQRIQSEEPFKLVKSDPEKGKALIAALVRDLADVSYMVQPFMPATADTILAAVKANKKPENLFKRID